uniref:Putative LOC101744434 [Bombyx mori] n=1 Tax=Lepeophtheirus salmonis TaxID=72036 RepID=A0A0K2TE88_LEPSM
MIVQNIFLLLLFVNGFHAENTLLNEDESKDGKVLSLFNVVTFPNDVCAGNGARNGTCLPANECASQQGAASGSCASGYGVCCVFVIQCGSMSSANCTYIEQTSISSAGSLSQNPCTYRLCRNNDDVCRLRLDFVTNILAQPFMGTAVANAAAVGVGGSIGDCIDDTMTLSSPGGQGSPTICGLNSGQHIIVDMSDLGCNELTFNLSPGSNANREWNIKATQFVCNDNDGVGGPPGCLQYFREPSGTVASFNFDTSSTAVAPTTTHLSSQKYNVCFRRSSSNCAICYYLHQTNSFGLSISSINNMAKSVIGSNCNTDWITIPEANNVLATPVTATNPSGVNRLCGRALNMITAMGSTTVCSISTPFILGVNFNEDEMTVTAADATMNELAQIPGGTYGFWLDYEQKSC